MEEIFNAFSFAVVVLFKNTIFAVAGLMIFSAIVYMLWYLFRK